MRLRKIAAVSTLALATAGVVAVAPATAATPENGYTCTGKLAGLPDALTGLKVRAVVDTNLGSTSSVGQIATGSAKVSVDAELIDLVRTMGGKSISGDATFNTTANGTPLPFSGVAKNVAVPASGDLVANMSGKLAPLAKVGATTISISSFKMKMTVKKADGDLVVDMSCSADAGSNTTVDTTNTVQGKAKIKAVGKVKKGKGTVTVTIPAANGGKVQVQVLQGKKVVKKLNGKVKKGKATLKVKGLKAGKYKLKVTYKGDAGIKAGKGKGKLTAK